MKLWRSKRVIAGLAVLMAVFVPLAPAALYAALPSEGGAGTTYTYIDSLTIVSTNPDARYLATSKNINSDTVRTFIFKDGDGCESELRVETDDFSKAVLKAKHKDTGSTNTQCQSLPVANVVIGDVGNAKIFYDWIDAGHIRSADSKANFILDAASGQFRRVNDPDKCTDVITPFNDNKALAVLHTLTENGGGTCKDKVSDRVPLGIVSNATAPAGTGGGTTGGGAAGGGGAADADTCDIGSLTWILCPVIDLAQNGVDAMGKLVKDQLEVSPLTQDSPAKAVWSVFRNLADVFIVLVFMVVIFGTSLEMDNYTVKKIMPRLIAAAILVQFSYIIVGLMVDITNILGGGIDSLMRAVVPDTVSGGGPESLASQSIAAVVVGIGVVAPIALLNLLVPFLLTLVSALIGLAVMFLTLQVRLMLITFLAMIAPIAIMLFVLPNTEKYFKLWRTTFVKLLLMYPIIVVLLASAKVFSATVSQATDSNLQQLLAAIVPIIAFFLIPATFKFAGSALSFAGGKISNIGGKGQSSLNGLRKQSKEDRRESGMMKLNQLSAQGKTSGFGVRVAKQRAAGGFSFIGMGDAEKRRLEAGKEKALNNRVESKALEYTEIPQNDVGALKLREEAEKAFENNDQATFVAAMQKMGTFKDGRNELATLRSKVTANGATPLAGKNLELWDRGIRPNYSAIAAGSPDVIKGAGAFDNMDAATLSKLDPKTAERAVSHWNNLRTQNPNAETDIATFNALPAGTATAQQVEKNKADVKIATALARANGAIETLGNSPTLKAGMNAGSVQALYGSTGTGVANPTAMKYLDAQGSNALNTHFDTSGAATAYQAPVTYSTSLPNVSPTGPAITAARVQETAHIATQQQQAVQSILATHAATLGTDPGKLEEKYFTDAAFKTKVDAAKNLGISVADYIARNP